MSHRWRIFLSACKATLIQTCFLDQPNAYCVLLKTSRHFTSAIGTLRLNLLGIRTFASSGISLASPIVLLLSPPSLLYSVSLPHYKQLLSSSWCITEAVNVRILHLHSIAAKAPVSGGSTTCTSRIDTWTQELSLRNSRSNGCEMLCLWRLIATNRNCR